MTSGYIALYIIDLNIPYGVFFVNIFTCIIMIYRDLVMPYSYMLYFHVSVFLYLSNTLAVLYFLDVISTLSIETNAILCGQY